MGTRRYLPYNFPDWRGDAKAIITEPKDYGCPTLKACERCGGAIKHTPEWLLEFVRICNSCAKKSNATPEQIEAAQKKKRHYVPCRKSGEFIQRTKR